MTDRDVADDTDDPETATASDAADEPDQLDGAATNGAAAHEAVNDDPEGDLPESVRGEALRLTRLARRASDEREAAAYRRDRDERLATHDYTARVREEDDTLVCYPAEWIEDGEVRLNRVDDTDRAYELTLSGPGDPDDWDAVADHNDRIVARVGERYGETHRANARSFAEFMHNHYARRMETATAEELAEFLDDYYPRNAWHDADTRRSVRESLRAVFDVTDHQFPLDE